MAYAYKNLKSPANIGSGIAELIWLAPKAWLTAISVPEAPFAAQGDSITITTAHTFAVGKGFLVFQLAPRKNKLDMKTVGDLGLNKQIVDGIEFFVAGSYAEVHEQMKNLLNTPVIGLVKDSNCDADLYLQAGCDCQFGYITCDFSTGYTHEGVKGYMCKLTYDGSIFIYKTGEAPVELA